MQEALVHIRNKYGKNAVLKGMNFYDKASDAIKKGASVEKIVAMPSRESIGRFKYVHEKNIENEYSGIITALEMDIKEALEASVTE